MIVPEYPFARGELEPIEDYSILGEAATRAWLTAKG
jgi:hypothetical protein